jgi:hypothetical protein
MLDAASAEFLALQRALAGRYSLVREIGRGGMGVVYLARDVNLDRSVAIKLLPPDMAGDSEPKERFLREARTAAQLSHPNIVPIHLVEERDGLVYFVMTVIEGESLGERVRRTGPLRSGEAVRMIQEVAWALAYAHGRGVVHRDIKPDNILIERATGRALLTDFGIARSTAAVGLTTPGLILGTLQYMAPEQADSAAPIDGRSDLYALGVTAFYALSGRLPFESEQVPALIAAHLLEPAPPVASVARGVPPKLAEAIDRCLLKDPNARWTTGEALADALSEVGHTSRAMPPSIRAFVSAVSSSVLQLSLLGLVFLWSTLLVPDQIAIIGKLLLAVGCVSVGAIIGAARAVAIAGYTARDVSEAVVRELKASDRYTEYVQAEGYRAAAQLRTSWGRILAGVVGAFEVIVGIGLVFDRAPDVTSRKLALRLLLAIPATWMGIELVGHAFQFGPFKHRLTNVVGNPLPRRAGLVTWLWSSAPVRGVLAFAGMLVRNKPARVAETRADRHTEAILATAADGVFAALPAADRAALAAVPDVVRHLELLAAGQRARKDVLDQAIASVGDAAGAPKRAKLSADLAVERAIVEQRLRSTVEALENLRLDLLRLRAGVGTTADLTEAIDAARRLGQEVDYTLHGRDEAARIA